jgi:hypothetical protein
MAPVRARTVPLRPLTVGELIDAAVEVTLGSARFLLPFAALLAVAEQIVMAQVRQAYFGGSLMPGPGQIFGSGWFAICFGTGLESLIIALHGVAAGRAAVAGIVGGQLRVRTAVALGDLPGALLIGLLAGITTFAVGLVPLGWFFAYPLFGLAVPALVIDRRGALPAIGRGLRLLLRSGGRAAGIRLLGYLAWLPLRIAFGYGAIAALSYAGLHTSGPVALWAGGFALAVVNTIAYATLAGIDAVLHLETRIRTEGLDIALTRAAGPINAGHLVVTP